jgi:hypothetical protein
MHTHLGQNLLLSIANPRVYHSALHSGSDSHKEFGLRIFPKSVLQQLVVAHGIKWTSPFTLPLRRPSRDAPGSMPARAAIPENLTIRFGAHRSSVYRASDVAKIAPFVAAAKGSVRESHARNCIQKFIQPKIIDEEFPDYQKLLDNMATDPTPVTLAAAPSASGQKRSRANPAEGEGDNEDIGVYGIGNHQTTDATGTADPALLPP